MEFPLIDLYIDNGHHGESLLERVGYGDNSRHVVLPHRGDSPADRRFQSMATIREITGRDRCILLQRLESFQV
jgi:hypothetical protein